MKMKRIHFIAVCVVVLFSAFTAGFPSAQTVESRPVDIWSDGTRLSGDLFFPKGFKAEKELPAIILCHGWGGLRSHLNGAYAPLFAEAGYVVLTFDYRGWGDSDSRLVVKGKMPEPDANGEVTVRAQAIRELVDPFDQTEDIINCINFIVGEPGVDPRRIGLWGTSFGGGHVLYVATHDNRVKCIVSQVPSMDGSWAAVYILIGMLTKGRFSAHVARSTQCLRVSIKSAISEVRRIYPELQIITPLNLQAS